MKIKKGDNVIVRTGKDKGKTGTVSRVLVSENKVIVDGLNIKKKHQKPTRDGKKGQVVEVSAPMNASNVMVVDPKTKKPTRVVKKKVGDKFIRVAQKSGTELK